jgi:signal transduction histidine kinase
LGQSAEEVIGRQVGDLRLADCLDDNAPRTLQKSFPGGSGRWGISHTDFREHGRRHRLLVLTDLTVQLREEELQAWQRLVRVLGHELNNSLAPIKSISGSIRSLLDHPQPPADWKQDVQQGLAAIGSRADALSRFTGAYARLAKMPEPRFAPVDVGAWIRRVAQLETRMHVEVESGPEITIDGDADQLEQMLINLVRNAVDAALETGGGVCTGWRKNHSQLEVWIRDDGPGISSDANLFVPFFTTKPGGSGIGLVLSRKIAENHRGTLTLRNRADTHGCETRLRIPLAESSARG